MNSPSDQTLRRRLTQHWPYLLALLPVLVEWVDDRRLPISLNGTITDIVTAVIIFVTIGIIQSQKRRLYAAGLTDQLTGLFNASHLEAELERQVALSHRTGSPLAVLFLDLDNFKSVNDHRGHAVGNDVLRIIGRHLLSVSKRDVDLCFRFGGDEFIILCQVTALSGGLTLAQRVMEACYHDRSVIETGIALSIGVSQLKEEEPAVDFLKRADKALQAAKESGKNRIWTAE